MCKCKVDRTDKVTQCTCKNQGQTALDKMDKKLASDILTAIKKALSDENNSYDSVEHLFASLGITQAAFEAAYKRFGRSTRGFEKAG